MKGLPSPQDPGAWRFLYLCLGALAFAGSCLVLLSSTLSLAGRTMVTDVAIFVAALLAFVSCCYRVQRSAGRRRRAWLLGAAALGFGVLGNLWLLITFVVGASPKIAKPGYIAFYLALTFGVLGMAWFPSARRRGTDLARMVLDGGIIAGSLLTIASVTVFPQLLDKSAPLLDQATTLLLPIGDVTIAAFAVFLFVRVGRTDRLALAFFSIGFGLYAITDLAFDILKRTDGSFAIGSPVDVGWVAGYLLMGLSALHPAAGRTSEDTTSKETSSAAGTIVIFTLLTIAAVLSMLFQGFRDGNLPMSLIWLLLVLAVATRQILLIVDNDRLRHGLERRVYERTSELRDLTRRSELLLSSVGEGIYGVDLEGLVTFVNPAGARALGYRPEELIGSEAHATFHAHQADGMPFPVEDCYVTQANARRSVTQSEEDKYVRADGRTFPVEVTATPLARNDVVQGAVVVFRDITQRLEVDRLKNEFVSMVSHELRTPLTSIRGSLGLLAGGALGDIPAPAMRMVTLALESSARLTRLINNILDLERIESDTVPLEIGDHSAAALIDTAVEQLRLIASNVEVELVVTHADGMVHADPDWVVQALINLLDNAIKFAPRRSVVEVAARVREAFVEFRVSDAGRGVPKGKLESIFRRFEQVDSSDAREKGGSGLGLAISRNVVERLGGRIWAESREGQGATFRFTVPLSDVSWLGTDADVEPSADRAWLDDAEQGAARSLR